MEGSSACIFLLATPWLIGDIQKVHRLEASEKALVSMPLIFALRRRQQCTS